MASLLTLRALIAIVIVAMAAPPTLATDYMVGDEKGWTLNFDYQAWAEGKEFHVGDKLTFKYPQGAHNVFRVDGTAFQQCVPPAGAEALTTGNDVIPLATPGRKWYICGVGKHCESGKMKLALTVLPQVESPASSPSSGEAPSLNPASAASRFAFSKSYAWIVGAFGVIMMIMV